MKLCEIKTNQTMGSYETSLLKKKIKMLGRGSSGVVFAHPTMPKVAVKVFVMEDFDYRDYVKWARRNPQNPFVPKFYTDMIFYELSDGAELDKSSESDFDNGYSDYGIVFMERLEKMKVQQWRAFWKSVLTPDDYSYAKEKEEDEFNYRAPGWIISSVAEKSKDRNLKSLFKFIEKYDHDVRLPNVMMRGTQPVFVDPVTQIQDPF